MTGEKRFAQAADDYMRYFLKCCVSRTTGLFAWGEHVAYNVLDRPQITAVGVLLTFVLLVQFGNFLTDLDERTRHGQAADVSLRLARTTLDDLLTGALVVRQVPPWFGNVGKRVVKAPKVYVRDSGLLHALLGMSSFAALEAHPKLGASWEGFALEEILRVAGPFAEGFLSYDLFDPNDPAVTTSTQESSTRINYSLGARYSF